MRFSSTISPVMTPTDEGTSCTFSSRFCAVTVMAGKRYAASRRSCAPASRCSGASAARDEAPEAATKARTPTKSMKWRDMAFSS